MIAFKAALITCLVATAFAADVKEDDNKDLTTAAGTLLGYSSSAAGLYGGGLYGSQLYGRQFYAAGWPSTVSFGFYGASGYNGAGLHGIGGVYGAGLYGSGTLYGWNNGFGVGNAYGYGYGY